MQANGAEGRKDDRFFQFFIYPLWYSPTEGHYYQFFRPSAPFACMQLAP